MIWKINWENFSENIVKNKEIEITKKKKDKTNRGYARMSNIQIMEVEKWEIREYNAEMEWKE